MADDPEGQNLGSDIATRSLVAVPDVATSPLGDELAILDPQSAEYFTLNATGAFLWTRLQTPHSLQSLVGALLEAFDVGEEAGRAEVTAFLEDLLDAGLVKFADA